ncbi:hypothetical protein E4T39_03525 [Aureobasidium subglaciale]|nr:hypothetical protein E4T39_03525 [Aureobasidium subglaciale]
MFASVLCHLNKDETASELISTSSNLFFVMRLAAKSMANPRIYVLRGSVLPSRKIYHLWPYHKRFVAEKLYYNGKYRNPSSHEYAIWATIPRTAILYNFALKDLERHLVGNPHMASIFRMSEMHTKRGNTSISKGFKKDKLELSIAMVLGIAQLMPEFGIVITSPAAIIARLVSEIIRGFALDLQRTTPERWEMLAGAFAYALSEGIEGSAFGQQHLIRAKEAFLSGARTGIGELNWHLNAKKQTKMKRKCLRLGLGVSQQTVPRATEQRQQAIELATYEHELLEEEDEDFDEEDDEEEDQEEDEIVQDVIDQEEADQEMVDQDISDRDSLNQSNDTTIDEEELETDIEEEMVVLDSQGRDLQHRGSQRRTSHPREVTSRSNKIGKDIIIIEDSDDEDYVVDCDMEY